MAAVNISTSSAAAKYNLTDTISQCACQIKGGFFLTAETTNMTAEQAQLAWQLQHFDWPMLAAVNAILIIIALKTPALTRKHWWPETIDIPITENQAYTVHTPNPGYIAMAGIMWLNLGIFAVYLVAQYVIL